MTEKLIDIEPIRVDVLQRSDFDTDEDFAEYLTANWPAAIIHNLFVNSILLGQVINRLKEIGNVVQEQTVKQLKDINRLLKEQIDFQNEMWGMDPDGDAADLEEEIDNGVVDWRAKGH